MTRTSLAIAAIGLAGVAALSRPAAADGDDWELRLPETAQVAPGASAEISVTVAPRPGRSISKDGPVVIDLGVEPATGLELPRRRYRRADAVDAEAEAPRFEIVVTGKRAGSYRVRVRARFWVCGNKTCRPVRTQRAVTVDVGAPGPDAGPAIRS